MCWPGEKAGKPHSCSASTVTFYGMLRATQTFKNLELEHYSLNLAKHTLEIHAKSFENISFICRLKYLVLVTQSFAL